MRTLIIKVVTELAEFDVASEDDWMSDRVEEIEDHLKGLPGVVMASVVKNSEGNYWS